MTNRKIQTVIIGGGQAGLAISYFLAQQGMEHVILEQASAAANAWRNDRWDSFSLLTPNWTFLLPGAEYDGDNPAGFLAKNEIITRFEQYINKYNLPVNYQVKVKSVEPGVRGSYLVKTEDGAWEAQQVVVATGLFQTPKTPLLSGSLSSRITQLHSGQYRNPATLEPGAVLVVGSGQSGCQIAEELYLSGRKVYLSTGSAGRAPRRYRGKDIFEWMHESRFLDRTADKLPSMKARFAANPHLSGRDGGRTLNLHLFTRDGVTLLGHLRGGQGDQVWLADDLKENLSKADAFEAQMTQMVDQFIESQGLDAPGETLPLLRDGYAAPEYAMLDLQKSGITTIIWAMGYRFDFSMVKLPVLDRDGFPIQQRGVTDFPGLYFVGMPWLYTQKSGLLLGVGEDAAWVAERIVNNKR